MSLSVKVPAFRNGGEIPARFTCSGADLSPALAWSGAPSATRSFALILEDPDAPGGTFTHWVIWNLPAQPTSLPDGVPTNSVLKNGACQGRNDFGRIGYRGPCPPPGRPHRYIFRLLALDRALSLRGGSSRAEVERSLRGCVLDEASWMGTFGR